MQVLLPGNVTNKPKTCVDCRSTATPAVRAEKGPLGCIGPTHVLVLSCDRATESLLLFLTDIVPLADCIMFVLLSLRLFMLDLHGE